MSHHPPTPPSWEAIQEPADDSSSDGDDDDDDDDEPITSMRKMVKGDRSSQALKRKDNDGRSLRASPVKRPRHEATGRVDEGHAILASVSAPGGSRQLHTSSAQPGPSRLANATSSATSISAAPRSQPPKFTSRPSKLSGNSKSSTKPPRPRYEQLSIFAKEGTTSKKKTQARTSQSATSSAIKPPSGTNEVIEISSDSEPAPARRKPDKPKPSKSSVPSSRKPLTHAARKSTGGGPKPKRKTSPEVIEITDSEEYRAPQGRLHDLVNEHIHEAHATSSAPETHKAARESSSGAAMETDYDVTALPFPEMETDLGVPSSPPVTSPSRTNTSQSSRVEPRSPPVPPGESSLDRTLSVSRSPPKSQMKNPIFDRGGMNPIPAPSVEVPALPQRPKHMQTAVKSASVVRRREPSSSSADNTPGDDSPHEGIDMRKLGDALDVIPTAVKPVAPPTEEKAAPLPQRPSALEHSNANPRNIVARKTSGSFTLADAINVSSQANAIKRRGKEAVKRMPIAERSPAERVDLQRAKDSSKMFTNFLSSRKGKGRASESSSAIASANPPILRRTSSSMPGVNESPIVLQPPPPPTSPSPRPEDTALQGLHRSRLLSKPTSISDLALEQRPRSAPSLGEIDSLGNLPARPSAFAFQPTTIPKSFDIIRKHIQPLSVPSLSEKPRIFSPTSVPSPFPVHSPKSSISEARPHPLSTALLPSPTLPQQASHLPISAPHSPARLRESSVKSPPRTKTPPPLPREEPSSATSKSEQPAVHVAAARAPIQITDQESAVLRSASNPAPVTSDDDNMQDAAEVNALCEDFEDEARFDMDVDDSDGIIQPEPIASSSVTSTRRSSRMSSRSSVSEHWPETAEEGEEEDQSVLNENKGPEDTVVLPSRKTYGGFRAITMKDYITEQKAVLRRCRFACDLPHIFQDYINNMPVYLRTMPAMRNVFEALIMENTVNDEPDAPNIEVQNDVDDEATPPWEFYYSNEMWLGEGVPRPDIENLVKCSCKGVCNPKSKTCACLKRQREECQDPNLEFAYDKTGKLQIPGYPIFECNDLCGCGDKCRNRVVQHGRKVSVAIRKTANKGWGVFATKKIPEGSFIGIYSGELITDVVAHVRGINYNKFGRTYLFDIDFHHLKKDNEKEWTNKFTVDAYHAGNFTRFLNHSCDPNSRLFACYINEGNIDKPLLVIFSLRDIEVNEEICFNYQGDYPGDEEDKTDEDGVEDNDRSSPPRGARDLIYERCMCGAKNCTGIMFK